MTTQYSAAVRNAQADATETSIGASPTLEIRTGAPPATCATADSGVLLATLPLPADWLTAAAAGVKTILGTWTDIIDVSGNAGHYRIKAGVTCHIQGTVSQRVADGGTGDLQLDRATVALVAGDSITVTAYTLTASGA